MIVGVADSTESTSCATPKVLWYTLKFIVTLLATSQRTSLGLEFAHSHGGKGSSSVVSGGVVVNLVDWNCGVHDVGLDDLLLDNWLNGLVDMVVNVLASESGRHALALRGSLYSPLVLELCLFLNKVLLRSVMVTVVKLAVLDSSKLCGVLLWQYLAILNWLNGAVVVILVHLLVYSCIDLLVLVGLDGLVNNRGSNSLMNSGVMVA